MKKLDIYLDTSVINFLFAVDAPEFMKVTKELFDNYIKNEKYRVFISQVVINEINATKNPEVRNKLLSVLQKYPIRQVKIQHESDAIIKLSLKYIQSGILPKTMIADANHIAISVVNNIDVLLSWNFKHLANIHREREKF